MIQRSKNKSRRASSRNENRIVDDIRELSYLINSTVAMNGFRNVGCISEDIELPSSSTLEYTGPLTMCQDSILTVPEGTTLTIV